jgi:hypothetical protein
MAHICNFSTGDDSEFEASLLHKDPFSNKNKTKVEKYCNKCCEVDCTLPKRYIEVLIPATCESDFIWKQDLCKMQLRYKLRCGHIRVEWVLNLI